MGKIKNWEKNERYRFIQWTNKISKQKVTLFGRANNFGGKNDIWSLEVQNKGQYLSIPKFRNPIKYESMVKSDALSKAIKFMRANPNG